MVVEMVTHLRKATTMEKHQIGQIQHATSSVTVPHGMWLGFARNSVGFRIPSSAAGIRERERRRSDEVEECWNLKGNLESEIETIC